MKLVTRNSNISELDLSVRAVNCLKRIKVFTVGDLLEYPEDAFLHVRRGCPKATPLRDTAGLTPTGNGLTFFRFLLPAEIK